MNRKTERREGQQGIADRQSGRPDHEPQLTLSDVSSFDVGTLPNAPEAGPRVVELASRNVTWVKFTVTGVSATTENVGLAELAVYGE